VEQELIGLRQSYPPVVKEELRLRQVPETAMDGTHAQAKRVGDPLDSTLRWLAQQPYKNEDVLATKHLRASLAYFPFSGKWKFPSCNSAAL
jgi:hypothetical protein